MLADCVVALDALLSDARRAVSERVTVDGRVVSRRFDSEQRATHGLAWLATYVEAIRQLAQYAQRLADTGAFGEVEELLVRIGAGEYLAQVLGGIAMSQSEIVRLTDLGLNTAAVAARLNPAVNGKSWAARSGEIMGRFCSMAACWSKCLRPRRNCPR